MARPDQEAMMELVLFPLFLLTILAWFTGMLPLLVLALTCKWVVLPLISLTVIAAFTTAR
jgi:hypothetical protein